MSLEITTGHLVRQIIEQDSSSSGSQIQLSNIPYCSNSSNETIDEMTPTCSSSPSYRSSTSSSSIISDRAPRPLSKIQSQIELYENISKEIQRVPITGTSGVSSPYRVNWENPPCLIDMSKVPSYQELTMSPRKGRETLESTRTEGSHELLSLSNPSVNTSPEPCTQTPRSPSSKVEKERFSPRTHRGRISPKAIDYNCAVKKFEERLTNDNWIDSLPEIERARDIAVFNTTAKKEIEKVFKNRKEIHLQMDVIKARFNGLINSEIDKYLTKEIHKKTSSKALLNTNTDSPRSIKTMQNVLSNIHRSDLLLGDIIHPLIELKEVLINFIDQRGHKTNWTRILANNLSYLIFYKRDLRSFIKCFERITDESFKALFTKIFGKEVYVIIEYLKAWTGDDSYKLLRPTLAEINLDFKDAQHIQDQKHYLWEEGITGSTINHIHMIDVYKNFLNSEKSSLSNVTINGQKINIKGLQDNTEEGINQFFNHFLTIFYRAMKIEREPESIVKEIKAIREGSEVPSDKILWIATMPWKHFYEKVRLLYPGLFNDVIALPKSSKHQLVIDVEPNGRFKVTRIIDYQVYEIQSMRGNRLREPNLEKPIAVISFYWTATLCNEENGQEGWCGCIQIPNPIRFFPRVGYEMKWGVLKSIIEYFQDDKLSTIKKLPLIKDKNKSIQFVNKLIHFFDNPNSIPLYDVPSPFILEFILKNQCREIVEEHLQHCSKNEKDRRSVIGELSFHAWNELQTNGKILEPMISRLKGFEEILKKYIILEAERTPWSDLLLDHLRNLIKSKKYAELDSDANKDLKTFLKIIEKDIKDDSMRHFILKVMCGRWENKVGEVDSTYQYEHIKSILNTLQFFCQSSKFLFPIIEQIYDDSKQISIEHVTSVTHEWIEPTSIFRPIHDIQVQQIVRCFMEYNSPIFKKITINGEELQDIVLEGTQREKKEKYYTHLLTTIYKYLECHSPLTIPEQVQYMLDYEKQSAVEHLRAAEYLPCLDILRLCTNGAWGGADILIRNLYDINNPPIKSNLLQNIWCQIEIQDKDHFEVELERRFGVFQRAIPDDITSTSIRRDRLLAEILFTWKLFPYYDQGRQTFKGLLRVKDVLIHPTILAEEKNMILRDLQHFHTKFRNEEGWENKPKEPVMRQLLPISKDRNTMNSPSYLKRSKTSSNRASSSYNHS